MENILRWNPIRRAAEMSADRFDYENPAGIFSHPDAIRLQELLVYSHLEISGVANVDYGVWLEECAREKITQKHQEIDAEIPP